MIIKKYRIIEKRLYRRTKLNSLYENTCSGCYSFDLWCRSDVNRCFATKIPPTHYKYLPQPTEKCY